MRGRRVVRRVRAAKTPRDHQKAQRRATGRLPCRTWHRLDQLGLVPEGRHPESFAAFLTRDAERLTMLIKTKRWK